MSKNTMSEFSSNHVKDLRGKRFGKVKVLEFAYSDGTHSFWKCDCDCGNTVVLSSTQLKINKTPNCGCIPKNSNRPNRLNVKTHHMTNTRIYKIWKSMRYRCVDDPNRQDYKNYASRGISVCKEWENSFEAFYKWAIENGYRDDLTIDRIDNDGNYEPSNCRWVDNTTQQRNRRRTVKLTYKCETKALTEWCEIFGLKFKTCYGRLHAYGWKNPQEILFGKGGTEECQRIY